MAAQNFGGNAVKSSHPDRICNIADQSVGTVLHLACGTVGKSHHQAVPRVCFHGGQDIGQPGGQHFGLAGAGARKHQQRAFGGGGGQFLFGIKLFQPRQFGHQPGGIVISGRRLFAGQIKYVVHCQDTSCFFICLRLYYIIIDLNKSALLNYKQEDSYVRDTR